MVFAAVPTRVGLHSARPASHFRRCVNRNGRVKGELLLTGGVVVELRRRIGLDLADDVLEGVPALVPHVELLLPQRPLRRCELLAGSFPPRVRSVRGGSEGGITCVVTTLLKVTRRFFRFLTRFSRARRARFPIPGAACAGSGTSRQCSVCRRCAAATAAPLPALRLAAQLTPNRGSRRLMVSRYGPHV